MWKTAQRQTWTCSLGAIRTEPGTLVTALVKTRPQRRGRCTRHPQVLCWDRDRTPSQSKTSASRSVLRKTWPSASMRIAHGMDPMWHRVRRPQQISSHLMTVVDRQTPRPCVSGKTYLWSVTDKESMLPSRQLHPLHRVPRESIGKSRTATDLQVVHRKDPPWRCARLPCVTDKTNLLTLNVAIAEPLFL